MRHRLASPRPRNQNRTPFGHFDLEFYEELRADFDIDLPAIRDGVTDGIVPLNPIASDLLIKATQSNRRSTYLSVPHVTTQDGEAWSTNLTTAYFGAVAEFDPTAPDNVLSLDGVSRITADAKSVDPTVILRSVPTEAYETQAFPSSAQRAVRKVRPGTHRIPSTARGVIGDQSVGFVVVSTEALDMKLYDDLNKRRHVAFLIKPTIFVRSDHGSEADDLLPRHAAGLRPRAAMTLRGRSS